MNNIRTILEKTYYNFCIYCKDEFLTEDYNDQYCPCCMKKIKRKDKIVNFILISIYVIMFIIILILIL
jgi:predicted amidophosphoribosyltransferase